MSENFKLALVCHSPQPEGPSEEPGSSSLEKSSEIIKIWL